MALTHIAPDTPGGEYLRRYWHPVAMVEDVGEWPFALCILGEDPVLFRDGGGWPDLIGLGRVDFMGQTPDRPLIDRQRNPGDWDAQVGQRRIAVPDNEHLASTDRGVSMLRRGIDAVNAGTPLQHERNDAGSVVPSYDIDSVIDVREVGEGAARTERFGRRVAEIVIGSGHMPVGERQHRVEVEIRAMVAAEFTSLAATAS